MQIIVVGCGSVGTTLIEHLSKEDHNITVVDMDVENLTDVANTYDVMGIVGNGASFSTLKEAGIDEADLMVAVTSSDELNLLSCLVAKKAGDCKTVARVRNPVYRQEVGYIKEELGLSLVINPEEAAAAEAVRLLKFPSAKKAEIFSRRAEMVTITIEEGSPLTDKPIRQVQQELKTGVLFCVVSRGGEVTIPFGDFVLKAHDELTVIGSSYHVIELFHKLKLPTARVHSTIIAGGGGVSFYLAQQLIALGIDVRIFEKDKARCKELSNTLQEALIINAPGTDRDMLLEEGLADIESFVALTDVDEENIMLSLFAGKESKAKRITMLNHAHYGGLLDTLDVGAVIDKRTITAERITQFVRGMNNSLDSNIESLYAINDGKAEVLEFLIGKNAPVSNVPLVDLDLKKDVLIALIIRQTGVVSPRGDSVIHEGDRVVVVTTHSGFEDVSDILNG